MVQGTGLRASGGGCGELAGEVGDATKAVIGVIATHCNEC